ncbi:MAG: hypothetical protein KDD83_13275 [Caldilineaceae bacterium]|nr:hypothetical protein [Caldilineaceae bacterium]
MDSQKNSDIQDAWFGFLQDVVLAKNYDGVYVVDTGRKSPNPMLDEMLPSLLYIKAVAILDLALREFISVRGLKIPRKLGRDSLHTRLKFLNTQSLVVNYVVLKEVKDLRNLVAHQAREKISWGRLETDIGHIEEELIYLGFIGEVPAYEFFAERGADDSNEEISVSFSHVYTWGVMDKADKRLIRGWRFTRKYYDETKLG